MIAAQWINRLAEFVEDWSYLICRDGWRSTLGTIGQEVIRLPYRHFEIVLVARSLLEPLPTLRPKNALEIRELVPTDLQLVRKIDRPSQARLCARRLARGHKGLLALLQGQPVGYAWGCAEVDPTLERVSLKLNPGDMLCVDAYTSPAFRHHGVQTALTLARFGLFRDLGYSRAIAYIEKYNYPSLAVWRGVGSQVVGHIRFTRIGPWRRSHLTGTPLSDGVPMRKEPCELGESECVPASGISSSH
jgi:GNAT superfamily N-acetyltransferase